MRPVYIAGCGLTPVGEHWARSLEGLGVEALQLAQNEAPQARIQALYVANALGGDIAGQAQLGAHLASAAGLGTIEAWRVEAAGASGGVALRQAYLAVASGAYDCVAVLGVEKVTDVLDGRLEAALALGLDGTAEAEQGLTLAAGWALLQRRYSHLYDYEPADFAVFPVNAHANGVKTPHALYRFPINPAKVAGAALVASPISLLDSATIADGAAAVILTAGSSTGEGTDVPIRIAGSAIATAPLALAAREDPLWLSTVAESTKTALHMAGVTHEQIDVADLGDQHGIVAALSLEAAGFARRGEAPRWAGDGRIALGGELPLATAGGCKARGDTAGALGLYQVVELTAQLRGTVGANQVSGARTAFAQCLGGLGATAATHVLIRE
jgi:acetyl-CoA C-acetyltransferase